MKDYNDIRSMSEKWDFREFVEMLPNNGFLLEIGSFLGKSAVCWAKTFKEQEKIWDIHTVDVFEGIIDPRKMSDMHFDSATREGHTVFESIQQKYALAGYPCPQIVFWNLNARGQNYPVQSHQSGAALVSGYSPSILGNILSQNLDELSPMQVMLDVLNSPRYQQIRFVA